jgi:hypothetical protein
MKDRSATANGIGYTGVLFIVFLILKLTDHIDWSWWWVASPLFIYFLLIVLLVVVEIRDKKRNYVHQFFKAIDRKRNPHSRFNQAVQKQHLNKQNKV